MKRNGESILIRKLSWLLIIVGGLIVSWNLYHWWSENSKGTYDMALAESIVKDWEDVKPRVAISQGITSNTNLTKGNEIGKLIIPRLDGAILPIVHGTDDQSLKKGVGHYIGYGTVKPGETGHMVLSGHRDTVFRGMAKVQKGDQLIVEYDNQYFIYQVRKMWVTKADDRTVIVSKDRPILTLTTCYPFDYVGSAPDRYIVESELIQIKKK